MSNVRPHMSTMSLGARLSKVKITSRWMVFFGMLGVGLVGYLAPTWSPWIAQEKTDAATRLALILSLAVLFTAGVFHFMAAFILRYRTLAYLQPGGKPVLEGFTNDVSVTLTGPIWKLRSTAELAGASGDAYFARIQGRWFFAVEQAADAVRNHSE
jgi:hypothetical protein